MVGYLVSVAVEAPILALGLSAHHSRWLRWFAGFWLTACSYPLVILVLPGLISRGYVPVAETLAPLSECLLFAAAVREGRNVRDMAVIVAANLASFGFGVLLFDVLGLRLGF